MMRLGMNSPCYTELTSPDANRPGSGYFDRNLGNKQLKFGAAIMLIETKAAIQIYTTLD
jgi:hypothetical protein